MAYKPKFISFDCYGTLINFEMGPNYLPQTTMTARGA